MRVIYNLIYCGLDFIFEIVDMIDLPRSVYRKFMKYWFKLVRLLPENTKIY